MSWDCGSATLTWYSFRVANSSLSLPAGFQRRHCENCVIRIDLVRLVLALDHLLGNPRMLQICSCCTCCPELVELSVVFVSFAVLVHHLGVQRQVQTFLILTLFLPWTLRFFGVACTRTSAVYLLDAAGPPRTSSLPESSSSSSFILQ